MSTSASPPSIHPTPHLSLQPSLELLRRDDVTDELSGAFQHGLGLSSRLASSIHSPLEGEVLSGHGVVNGQDKNAVNTYFDQMRIKLEEARLAMLQGDAHQAQSMTKELQQAVSALPSPTVLPPVDGPSVRSSRSGSVSSYRKHHSASNSIDSSTSSPPLSYPYPSFSAPSVDGSARSLKRSASFSDWDEDEVDLDSGRLTKSMRMSDWYDEDDEDEAFVGAGLQSPQQGLMNLVQPQQQPAQQPPQQNPQMPQLVHAHSFPSMHDLPSQTTSTIHSQPLASPIPPRVPTISNATIVPSSFVAESKPGNHSLTGRLSLARLRHLEIDTSGSGAMGASVGVLGVGSVPASPVDYVPHPMPSFYPIQTWVDSLGQGYLPPSFDTTTPAEHFPSLEEFVPEFPLVDGVGDMQTGYFDIAPMNGEFFQSPVEWPPIQIQGIPLPQPMSVGTGLEMPQQMEVANHAHTAGNTNGHLNGNVNGHANGHANRLNSISPERTGEERVPELANLGSTPVGVQLVQPVLQANQTQQPQQVQHQQPSPPQQLGHQQPSPPQQLRHQQPSPPQLLQGQTTLPTQPQPQPQMQVQAQLQPAQTQAQSQPAPVQDNRSLPSLSRSASRISGVQKHPRRQASLSVVPRVSGVGTEKVVSPGRRSGFSSPTGPTGMTGMTGLGGGGGVGSGGEIALPAPPLAGILQQQQGLQALQMQQMQQSFNFSLLDASSSSDYSPAKIKSEVPSRPLSRQPSHPSLPSQPSLTSLAQVAAGGMDLSDLGRRLKRSGRGRMSPVSSEGGEEDADAEDEEEEVEVYVGGGSRRPSAGENGKLSRNSSKRRTFGEPHVISHANTVPSELKQDVDRVFFEFLSRLCSNLDMTDSKGELIHQALMPKKMQKLDESPDFRPFKFRIQAFTNALVEELNRQGFTEAVLPLKKVRTYLWSQPYISRYNEDGRKSKSKGNHIWNIHAKKMPDGLGWAFREYKRRITGTPAGVAYIGLEWRWSPSIWDPQQSRSSMHPVFSSPALPPWLQWKDNELVGTPCPGDMGGEIMAEAVFPNDNELKVTHTFKLEVVELPPGEPLSLQKTRRPSAGTVSSAAPPVAGRNRSHTMSTAFTSESDVPPVPRLPLAFTQAQQQENNQIRHVLEMAAAYIAQEATQPVPAGMLDVRQRQASLAKQQEVLSRAVQAFNYVAFSLEPLPVDFAELVAAAKRVVKDAGRQVAERQAKTAEQPTSVSTVPINDVILATRALIAQAVSAVGLQASEIDIMRAATALIQQNGPGQVQAQPMPMPQPAMPQGQLPHQAIPPQMMPPVIPHQQQQQQQQVPIPQQVMPPPAPPPVVMPMTIDPVQLTGGIPPNGVPAGFQNLASIHPAPEMLTSPRDLSAFVFLQPGAPFDAQSAGMGQLPRQPLTHVHPHASSNPQ
ncbi:hypothetical protein DACRYDRAFT_98049 [Dacryopinax primogenitus]|uniref:Uncharacterized protein n=1 Tax=Dacryopinax primogenitus (strain DJM 731) TaxID=1858805 RepID=M5GA46_DACPD|nr:uncharacterized protein DACRYDRAFT_98049 [Dacryopinax primogenitus]EJU05185.1 hypothetical protein DACRYDRAFT_98049 [Dacryopinax primogenitus]